MTALHYSDSMLKVTSASVQKVRSIRLRSWVFRTALVGLTLMVARPRQAASQVEHWWPVTGTVVLAGGALAGATSDSFVRRIIDLAGGADAQIVVIPTANSRADTAALRKEF